MSSRQDSIRKRITDDHQAAITILKSFTPEQWAKPAPSEQDAPWAAKDVLAHLADSEGGILGQLNRCLAGEVTVPDGFDLSRWNRRVVQKRAESSIADLLGIIETTHQQVLQRLETVSDAELDKTGKHARGDVITIEEFFTRITEHRKQHAEELKKVVG